MKVANIQSVERYKYCRMITHWNIPITPPVIIAEKSGSIMSESGMKPQEKHVKSLSDNAWLRDASRGSEETRNIESVVANTHVTINLPVENSRLVCSVSAFIYLNYLILIATFFT